ncbi:hypothetical protein ABIC99_003223 [Sphaerotilus sulfidivorans]|jgi:hypothetical protein|uniref:Uncharacterized protein n=1 Tax=Sphaerotilus sulfidivorans TaxID=639200 RepID=A0A5C1Q0S5_9BURK|nr:hypothetical protein [Sphaerotilus sulfidivorans]NZD46896.1 hypothetical protein [Sphaerotilus sulfidivorans]QEN00590.1 hypothetical protein EWH46_07240 [Sphaerotilus sulfidivorans]
MSDKHTPAADSSLPLWRRLHTMLRSEGSRDQDGPRETDSARMDLGYEAAYALPAGSERSDDGGSAGPDRAG